jgi:hypothetical protein
MSFYYYDSDWPGEFGWCMLPAAGLWSVLQKVMRESPEGEFTYYAPKPLRIAYSKSRNTMHLIEGAQRYDLVYLPKELN